MHDKSRRLIEAITKYKNILIYIAGSPDPDAIASSFALMELCSINGVKSTLAASMNLSLQQNRAFVEKLDIPLVITDPLKRAGDHDAYAVLDYQTAGTGGLGGLLPCAVHIDHHEPVENDVPADFRMVRADIGSTSSIMALLIMELAPEFAGERMRLIATALSFGIQIDTDNYAAATGDDLKALNYLSKYADGPLLKEIADTPLSEYTTGLLWAAMENKITYRDWLIAGVGFVNESDRDSIPVIADIFLRKNEAPTVVVFGAIENRKQERLRVDASFRSTQSRINLNEIIKEITQEGGARKNKGAYQIQMDYLSHCPDRDLLWRVINMTTFEILKKSRDRIYVTELKGVYRRIKRWVAGN